MPSDDDGNSEQIREDRALVRSAKAIVYRAGEVGEPDPAVVNSHLFNAFHHTMVTSEDTGPNITIGITSAHTGEGKTTVAANMAVSTAVATERETLLVDFNPRYPRLHTAFGIDIRPGLADAIVDPTIYIASTTIKHLHLLTAGNVRRLGISPDGAGKRGPKTNGTHGSTGLSFLSDFRDVLYSLQKQFAFIIVDMAAATDSSMPIIFTQQMHGLVVVVDAQSTKREDIDYIVRRLGTGRVRGFVLNKVEKGL